MARPRSYDEETVLRQARELFWQNGFEATGVDAICAATGLKKGSLYLAFGDKHTLFARILREYLQEGRAKLRSALSGSRPLRERLSAWLLCVGGESCGAVSGKGCMGTNTMIEMAPSDDQINALLVEHAESVVQIIAHELTAGQADGVVRSDRSADDMARYLFVLTTGLSATGRTRSPIVSEAAVELALDSILLD